MRKNVREDKDTAFFHTARAAKKVARSNENRKQRKAGAAENALLRRMWQEELLAS